ncbi:MULTISPECIES: hypothetical protein [Staphylococcus]|nr:MULTISPECIES: hypothetical protein [Staphylococcus]MBF2751521.1 hypothetical protein [Staphylococcus saprophyticus]MDK1672716.1 hypothetical protein [Staphylococcus saprophyticus]MDW3827214.1 hypothetical protein [Staphylococcus saprophyticus]MDW3896881.1 hypothetical protein [Staphylococcus saprophyticus]MDW4367107.1 hypothetical protein [Staphylococcus saprophyticus]
MEKYGWTLTEVKSQPYFPLLELLNDDEESEQEDEEQEVITGSALRNLFG